MDAAFLHSDLFRWVVLPVLIFLARIMDVSLGTIRIVFVARGEKVIAPLLGFFEVLVWLLAIGQIFKNLDNVFCYIAYAGGFAMGNFIGIKLEEKLAVGKLVVRIITQKDASKLVSSLMRKGFGVTSIDATGRRGKVALIYTFINRKDLGLVEEEIQRFNPRAFYSIDGIRSVRSGIFRKRKGFLYRRVGRPLKMIGNPDLMRRWKAIRKGK